ncbi:MAG: hypothetical protein RIQ52_289 [Pseudomonadota bacterium]|jgi:small multidrug resistance pump
MNHWILLLLAILSEVFATSALKTSDGFSRLWPSVMVIAGYATSFYLLAQTLRVIPVGVAYAIWSGVGTVLITLIGWSVYGQRLDLPALLGIGMITTGVIVMNLFSSAPGSH